MSAQCVREFVRVLVKDENKQVLVVVHKDGQNTALNFPGGKVDNGEKPEEAVLRELFEETGMLLKSTILISDKYFNVDGEQWKGYFFYGESLAILPRNMEPHKHSFVGFYDVNLAIKEGRREFVSEPIELVSKLYGW